MVMEPAVLTAIGIIWILCRFNLKRIAGYATIIDIGLFALLAWIFMGTYAGMITGIIAGVFVSAFLTTIKKIVGAERIKLVRYEDEVVAKPRWRPIP